MDRKIILNEYKDEVINDESNIDFYACDECGNVYDRGNLFNHWRDKFLICKKCCNEYREMFK